MRSGPLVRLIILASVILTLPTTAHAQEAVINGTVTDSTGGVLPGVTVTALHQASGNTFEAVTDGRGIFRVAARAGSTASLRCCRGFRPSRAPGSSCCSGNRRS